MNVPLNGFPSRLWDTGDWLKDIDADDADNRQARFGVCGGRYKVVEGGGENGGENRGENRGEIIELERLLYFYFIHIKQSKHSSIFQTEGFIDSIVSMYEQEESESCNRRGD